MKALDEYILMVVFTLLLSRVHVFFQILCLIRREKHGSERDHKSLTSSLAILQQLHPIVTGHSPRGFQILLTNGMMGNRRLVDGAPSQTTQLIAWNFLREETHYNHHNATYSEYDDCCSRQTKKQTN